LSPSDELASILDTTLSNGVKVVVDTLYKDLLTQEHYIYRGQMALQGNFGTGVQLKLRKHPNAYIAIK
jgi:hypothetical protein